jgi:hypothetical protein
MEITQDNLLRTVQNIREMIKDHILPRLTELECEINDLRKVTWPVCQNVMDEKYGVFATMNMKRKFLYHLDDTDARELLKRKGRLGGISSQMTAIEYQHIFNSLHKTQSSE